MPSRVVGLKELQKRLKGLGDSRAKKAQRKALREQAKVLQQEMKINAPVDTGNLRRSIAIKVDRRRDRKGFYAAIGPAIKTGKRKGVDTITSDGGRYAPFVEFGTMQGQQPQPFVRETWEDRKNTIDNDLRKEVLRQIIRIARGQR